MIGRNREEGECQQRGQRWMESDGEEYRAVRKREREFKLREERKREAGARETFPVGQQLGLPAQQTKFDG